MRTPTDHRSSSCLMVASMIDVGSTYGQCGRPGNEGDGPIFNSSIGLAGSLRRSTT